MTDLNQLARLFAGWEETMIWSCLQGIMGRGELNASGDAGLIVSRDFSFLAGRPDRSLLTKAPGPILAARPSDWHPLIESFFGPRAVRETRYAIRKEPGVFDRRRLEALAAALPPGYELRCVDEDLAAALLAQEWSQDMCSLFGSPAGYCARCPGAAVLYEGVPVAGAGCYSVYEGGIEVEIGTREDHRRRGLAAACGAKLILLCLDRGLYPSWDAANPASAALAEKLGYRRGEAYPVYQLE